MALGHGCGPRCVRPWDMVAGDVACGPGPRMRATLCAALCHRCGPRCVWPWDMVAGDLACGPGPRMRATLRAALGHGCGPRCVRPWDMVAGDVACGPWPRMRPTLRAALGHENWGDSGSWPTAMFTVAWGQRVVTRQRDTKRRPRKAHPQQCPARCRRASPCGCVWHAYSVRILSGSISWGDAFGSAPG